MDNHSKVLLLDFYGSILTAKQFECMDLHYNEDLSLAEIAEQLSITRQGVYDLVKRSQDLLQKMEDKLGFIEKFKLRILAAERVTSILDKLSENENDGQYSISKAVMNSIKAEMNIIIEGEMEEVP